MIDNFTKRAGLANILQFGQEVLSQPKGAVLFCRASRYRDVKESEHRDVRPWKTVPRLAGRDHSFPLSLKRLKSKKQTNQNFSSHMLGIRN